MVKALYLHIPFCSRRCPYCDFTSFTGSEEMIPDYLTLLPEEARLYADYPHRIETLYVGGGTPSVLAPESIGALVDELHRVLDLSALKEFTVECNPENYSYREFRELLSIGVNRVSIGVQSFTPKGLRTLGRSHSAEKAVEAVISAREAGFENVSLDLIYGYPDQEPSDLRQELRWIEELRPTHLSAYLLTLHEGTPLHLRVHRGELSLPSEEELCRLHGILSDGLRELGYERYEISNWSLPGYRCRHNLVYWNLEEFFGLGVSAWGFVEGRRYCNLKDLAGYRRRILEGKRPLKTEIPLSEEELFEEFLMLRLRLRRGLPHRYRHLIPPHLRGFFEEGGEGIGIREEYLLLSDEIITEVLLYNSHRNARR